MEKLRRLVINHDVDILGLTETNKRWSVIPEENTIWSAVNKWKEHTRTYATYNKTDPGTSEQLYGGTAISVFNENIFHIQNKGEDTRRLGRWNWIELQGKNNFNTTVICAYCPCISSGPHSVWSQHILAMNDLEPEDQGKDPRELFWSDLTNLVQEKQQEGKNIVLMGDFNSDFTDLQEWMLTNGLVESICEIHGYENAPITHTRSHQHPLDGIFCSPNIKGVQGGYLSFQALGGNHRGLWIDIPKIFMYGHNPQSVPLASARRLKLEDPRVVKKYNDECHAILLKTQVYQRLAAIHHNATFPPPVWACLEYEKCDQIIQDAMDKAEAKCRKFKCGNTSWSPAYQIIHDEIDYWKLRERYYLGLRPNMNLLKRLGKRANIKYTANLDRQGIMYKLSLAHQKRKEFKLRASSESLEYRNRLATAKEKEGKLSAAHHLRSMNEREEIRKLFRTIKLLENKGRAGTTAKIQITNDEGQTEVHTLQHQVEQVIANVNEKKYHQTENGSQLLNAEFRKDIGNYGEGPEVDNILKGQYKTPENTSQATKDFLQACKAPTNNQEQEAIHPDPVQRFTDFVQSWKIRRESTMTYNQHVGHYKAACQHPYLSWCLFQRHEFPVISGYSPNRHKRCIDLSILKRSGDFNIDKQRTIGILDSEFNHMNRDTGRQAMRLALQKDEIAVEQYSRPQRSALDHALNRVLTFDHFKYSRKPYCMASCDLKGCYDRIIHNAAAIALIRVGVPKQKVFSMFNSIQKMIHKIRTVYGDSEISYGGEDIGDWENFPQGVLQGNASGPQIWSILSSIIFSILRKKGFSTHFCSCLSKSIFLLIGYSYVDDCDLLQAQDDPTSTLQSMQEVINQWSELMKVTGGQIAAEKSWWYLVDIVWQQGKWVAADAEFDLPLTTPSPEGPIALKHLPCDVASEMLGIFMAPKGNHEKMLHTLRKKSLEWASQIKMGGARPEIAWTALHKTISERLKYAMATCKFTEKECKHIMAPALTTGLQKSGISKNFPIAARHAPILSGGLHVLDLYVEMGTARTQALLNHSLHATPTSHLLTVNIEHLILESGLYGPIWDAHIPTVKKWCATDTWIYHTLAFNHQHHIHLNLPHTELKPARQNDRAIMEIASHVFKDTNELKAINKVRMLHEVIHLSDITSANGRSLDPAFLISDPFPEKRNEYSWPDKHHVYASDFTSWRKLMEYIFCYTDSTLPLPLGQWKNIKYPHQNKAWHWFISENNKYIYERVNDGFVRHIGWQRDRRRFYYDNEPTMLSGVENLQYVSVSLQQESILILNKYTSSPQPPTLEHEAIPFSPLSISKYLRKHLPPWASQRIRTSQTLRNLRQSMLDGKALLVSDGSLFPHFHKAGAAWIISTPDCVEFICGGGTIPGPTASYNSHRSEAGGITGGSCAFYLLSQILPTHPPTLTAACDGISALKHYSNKLQWIKTSQKSVDFAAITAHIGKELDTVITPVHVKGHQDKEIGPRTNIETLNIHMDKLAKACAQSFSPTDDFGPFWKTKGLGTIRCHNSLITGNIKQELYNHICHRRYVKYMGKKLKVPPTIIQSHTHWVAFGRARKEAPHFRRIFISKWLVGQLPTGIILKQRKHRLRDNCPHCQQPKEDTLHLITCQSPEVRNIITEELQQLHTWMSLQDTLPEIANFLYNGILSWTGDPFGSEEPISHYSAATIPIFKQQLQIGWFATMSGFLHPSMILLQHGHYKISKSRKTGEAWGKKLILKLWSIIHKVWMLRNSVLHESEINLLQGEDHLNYSITLEHNIGIHGLSPIYQPYFQHSLTTILDKPLSYKKRWLLLIRRARETKNQWIPDHFTTNQTLRSWIHLPNTGQ